MNITPNAADAAQLDNILADVKRISDWKIKKIASLNSWATKKGNKSSRDWADKQILGATNWADGKLSALRDEYTEITAKYLPTYPATLGNSDKIPSQDKAVVPDNSWVDSWVASCKK